MNILPIRPRPLCGTGPSQEIAGRKGLPSAVLPITTVQHTQEILK
jgi:hypothetical protein